MVRCFDLGHHCRGIHFINFAPGNPLDPIYSFNRLYRYSRRTIGHIQPGVSITYDAYDFPMNKPTLRLFRLSSKSA